MSSQKRSAWDAETIEEMRTLMSHTDAGAKLREERAAAMCRSGKFNSATAVNHELRRLFGVGLKDETVKRVARENRVEPKAEAQAVLAEWSTPEHRLLIIEAKCAETLRMANRIFGMIGAVRHEIQRIADALGAPRDTTHLRENRVSSGLGIHSDTGSDNTEATNVG